MKIQFSFFKYSVDVQPLRAEQIQIRGTVKEKEEETVTVCIDTDREIVCNWPINLCPAVDKLKKHWI